MSWQGLLFSGESRGYPVACSIVGTFRSCHGRGYSCQGSLGVTPLHVRSWVPCGCCKARRFRILRSCHGRGYSCQGSFGVTPLLVCSLVEHRAVPRLVQPSCLTRNFECFLFCTAHYFRKDLDTPAPGDTQPLADTQAAADTGDETQPELTLVATASRKVAPASTPFKTSMSSCSIAGTSWSDDELHTPSENSVEPVLKTVVNPMATEMVESSAEGSDDELDIIYSVGFEGDVYWRQAIEVRTRDTIGEKEQCVYTTNPEAIGDFVLAYFFGRDILGDGHNLDR